MLYVEMGDLVELEQKGFSRIGFSILDIFEKGAKNFGKVYYRVFTVFDEDTRTYEGHIREVTVGEFGEDQISLLNSEGVGIIYDSIPRQEYSDENPVLFFIHDKQTAKDFIKLFNNRVNDPDQLIIDELFTELSAQCLSKLLKDQDKKER